MENRVYAQLGRELELVGNLSYVFFNLIRFIISISKFLVDSFEDRLLAIKV